MTDSTERNWVEEIGRPAYGSIAEMVAALQADRERLEELRGEFEEWAELARTNADVENRERPTLTVADWAAVSEDGEELADLESAVTLDGEEVDEDTARERIQEDALSVRIFGERTNGEWEADKFEILLTTGGPAVRIMGELDGHGEPDRAWLEVQDWGKPWTQYFQADQETLLAYCRCFYFGE